MAVLHTCDILVLFICSLYCLSGHKYRRLRKHCGMIVTANWQRTQLWRVVCAVPVKIVEPASKHTRVRTGSDVTLWCKADVRTTIRWYLNSTQPLDTDVSKGVYVVTGVERNGTGSTSRLHLAPARLQDSGRYSCRNIQDPGDNDTVVLTVTDSQQGTIFTLSSVNNWFYNSNN